MVSIAIIGILAAIAIPAYKNYSIRSKVSEVITSASSLEPAINEYVQISTTAVAPDGTLQNVRTVSGVPTKYVSAVSNLSNGHILAIINIDAIGGSWVSTPAVPMVALIPTVVTNNGSITLNWTCQGGSFDSGANTKYYPSTCQ